jgi:hypothetical protein
MAEADGPEEGESEQLQSHFENLERAAAEATGTTKGKKE